MHPRKGSVVARRGTSGFSLGRQLTSCLAAYALVLQAILFSFAPFAPVLAAPNGVAGAEICLHDPSGAPVAPAEDKLNHCQLCLIGCPQQILAPVALGATHSANFGSTRILWVALFAPPAISFRYPSKPPRGPPATS
jgi:hypothetical protein